MSSISLVSSPITCRLPPQQGQLLSSMSTRTSTRGRCAGKAPRLRRRTRGGRGVLFLAASSSWAASAAAAVCSRSSRPSCSWSGSRRSERRPNCPRCSCRIRSRSFSTSACAASCFSRMRSRSARTVSCSACNDISEAFCWSITSAMCCNIGSNRSGSGGRSSSASVMALFYWPRGWGASTSAHQAVLGRRTARGWSWCHGKPSSRVAS